VTNWVDVLRDGNPRDIARAITAVENSSGVSAEILTQLPLPTSHVIGLTGPPGVGKSTSTSALVGMLRSQGHRVAVLAVDPSSPFSKGALLGDRIRMQEHANDSGVFIRSLAARGHLGGLTETTLDVITVLSAAGFDSIIVETVGVGQSEIDIASAADTTIVITAPGMGDGIQAAKAGILEIADIFAVNKADREGAEVTVRELKSMIGLALQASDWTPPVIPTVATSGDGFSELTSAIEAHFKYLQESGDLERRREQRIRDYLVARALVVAHRRIQENEKTAQLAHRVACGDLSASGALEQLVSGFASGEHQASL
jgi:LAO/AO transport system kinase